MFATKKDFALLARQVALSSRTAGSDTRSLLVDVYQVRLWKVLHTPDQVDVDAIAATFQVCSADLSSIEGIVAVFCSVILRSCFTPSSPSTINLSRTSVGKRRRCRVKFVE